MKFFKKKAIEVLAPVEGKIVNIEDVPDEVFSQKLLGNGIAINPEKGLFFAPISGRLETVLPHAYGIVHKSGIQLLLHIGLDSVNLKGEGFDVCVKKGDMINAGDPLVSVDLKTIKNKLPNLISPIILTPNSVEGKKITFTDLKFIHQKEVLITIL